MQRDKLKQIEMCSETNNNSKEDNNSERDNTFQLKFRFAYNPETKTDSETNYNSKEDNSSETTMCSETNYNPEEDNSSKNENTFQLNTSQTLTTVEVDSDSDEMDNID